MLIFIYFLASSISKLKKLISELKGGKDTSNKPKVPRKRRRVEKDEDSSSDEAEVPKPKFGVNDIIQAKEESSTYGIVLDLSTTNNAKTSRSSIDPIENEEKPIPSGSKMKIKAENSP